VKVAPSARITLVTIFLLTVITVGVGGFSVLHSKSAEISQIDASLEYVAKSAYDNPAQPVSAALYALEQSSLNITLTFLTHDGQETIINESTLKYFGPPDFSIVEIATRQPIRVAAPSPYRLRSVLVQGGDYILLAESTQAIDRNFQSNVRSLALFTFGVDSSAALILFIYFRRNNRRTETASLARMQEFLGDASHELRTPLNVIKGYVEMLSKNQLTQESDKSRAFERVGTEITRMESLIRDLLLLAELGESGTRDVEVVDLSEIVKAHGTDFLTLNPSRSVLLSIEPEIFIDASRDYIARFIQNALTNILRHTAKDDAVKISLARHGRGAQLMIEDAGPGLPESAYKEDIRSLNRFDKSRSRDHGGSGLGMSIMSAVITKLDGTFSLRKSALGGLAIVVELPVAKD
jgi:two-component system, OmpR family, sensor kinase